jgi:hypothetical protein
MEIGEPPISMGGAAMAKGEAPMRFGGSPKLIAGRQWTSASRQ